jgi:hypothetical protein
LSSFSLSFTCSVFALLAIQCSRNALTRGVLAALAFNLCLSTRKGRRKPSPPPNLS